MQPVPTPADPAMQAYYAARACEYERIYAKPERQADLRVLEAEIPALLAGRSVLEVACGTGYWTQFIARSASRVLATDLTEESLQVARTKTLPESKVRYRIADAFNLPADAGPFDGAFAGFWWSHLRTSECSAFLASLHRCLAPGAVVVLMDNLYVEGSSTPIARRDAEGNTWQERKLDSGATHEVLKNFPSEAELRKAVDGFGTNCSYRALGYYWLFSYEAV
jgi:demethylmenaquinone methyltransferase/2-methoxy-6-polyprenyl-1,4-benzoquinol methylase